MTLLWGVMDERRFLDALLESENRLCLTILGDVGVGKTSLSNFQKFIELELASMRFSSLTPLRFLACIHDPRFSVMTNSSKAMRDYLKAQVERQIFGNVTLMNDIKAFIGNAA